MSHSISQIAFFLGVKPKIVTSTKRWGPGLLVCLAHSIAVRTCQSTRLPDMSKTTHLPCSCPLPTPSCQQTKTAFLSFCLPNLAQCLSVEEYNQNPAGKRIWGMQGELRRIRTLLKFNKLYVVSPTP